MTVPVDRGHDRALPVLDVGPFLLDETSPQSRAFVQELGRVVHEVGFLYLVGHGVSARLLADVHDVARRFFA